MKTTKRGRIRSIIMIVVPIVLFSLLSVFLINNHIHNTTRRVGQLTEENYNGEVYDFGDVSVKLGIRGGDSGAWEKNPIYDDGNMLHCDSVGTIYEPIIYNNSENVVTDWALKIPINEMMWLNNSWNGKMEIHQDVNGEEKVLTIDLRDYSEYDINLDYYIDHSGPMIPLNKGDYFIYYPEETANEKPIMPLNMGEASACFGYIVYIPKQTIDYVADFSGGEIVYYMYANPSKKVWFWVLIVLIFLWEIWTVISILVSKKIDRIMKQQQLQKEHDEMMVEQTMQIIINIIENKDTSTKGHSLRVAEYSQMIAQKLGYTEDESKQIYYIGLMHDCGKVNIPNSILKNPGKLSEEEYEIMKKHTVYGGDILRKFTSIPDIDVGAKYHHERYDGKGYPAGLVGEEIPMVARIIGVADAFDAMNSKRCYRDKLPKDIIMKELRENREKQFDPKVLDCILSLIEEGKINL